MHEHLQLCTTLHPYSPILSLYFTLVILSSIVYLGNNSQCRNYRPLSSNSSMRRLRVLERYQHLKASRASMRTWLKMLRIGVLVCLLGCLWLYVVAKMFNAIQITDFGAKQTATTMTMNSPDSLAELFHAASPDHDAVATAELMREVGLKCIGFNGVSVSLCSLFLHPLLPPLLPLLLLLPWLIAAYHRFPVQSICSTLSAPPSPPPSYPPSPQHPPASPLPKT
jgi:hypothetical protein